METKPPFDLNQAVRCWRDELASLPAFRGENLNELESHLRDSVSELSARGLSEEESFLIAARRLGKAEAMAQEFSKVNPTDIWRERAVWMLGGMLILTVGWDLIQTISSGLGWLGTTVSSNGWMLVWVEGMVGITLFALMAWLFWRLANGRLGNIGNVARRLSRYPLVFIVGTIFGLFVLNSGAPVFHILCVRNLGPLEPGQKYFIIRAFTMGLIPLVQIALMVVGFVHLLRWRAGCSAAKCIVATK